MAAVKNKHSKHNKGQAECVLEAHKVYFRHSATLIGFGNWKLKIFPKMFILYILRCLLYIYVRKYLQHQEFGLFEA